MCLETKYTKTSISEEDMEVFKIITCYNSGPYQTDYVYEPNRLYGLDGPLTILPCNPYNLVNEGFHAFTSLEQTFSARRRWFSDLDCERYKIVKMTIPKGSRVVCGFDGEIVSDKILTGDLESLI